MPTKVQEERTDKASKSVDELLKEALQRISDLEKAQEKHEQVLAEKDATIKKLTARGAGWLIAAKNPLYDGKIYGIAFINGQAFVPEDRVIPFFVREPMKDAQARAEAERQKPYKPGMDLKTWNDGIEKIIAGIRERESLTSAQLAVETIQSEYGYQVYRFTGSDDEEVQKLIDLRAKERAITQQKLDEETRQAENIRNISRPSLFGG